jgi:hypothetical protein
MSWGSSVIIVYDYGLYNRAIGVRSLAEAKDFSCGLCVHTGCVAHPASYPMGTGGPSPGVNHGRGVTLIAHTHLVPKSRLNRIYIPLPRSSCMACSETAVLFFTLL